MKRSIGIAQYRAECGLLAEHLVREQAVSDADVKAHTPGGANNPDKGADGWRSFDRWLQRRHAVMVHEQEKQGGNFSDADDMTLVDILRGAPEAVTCVARESDEENSPPMRVMVYTKSFHALMEVAQIDKALAWLAAHLDRLCTTDQVTEAKSLDLMVRIMPEMALLYQRLAWIVTHPGCGLPYPDDQTAPTPPVRFQRLDAKDFMRINAAHHRVNELNLRAVRNLISKESGGTTTDRPSWTVFFGAASEALKVRPETLMRDWSLAEALLMYRTANHAKAQAMENAKADAEKGR